MYCKGNVLVSARRYDSAARCGRLLNMMHAASHLSSKHYNQSYLYSVSRNNPCPHCCCDGVMCTWTAPSRPKSCRRRAGKARSNDSAGSFIRASDASRDLSYYACINIELQPPTTQRSASSWRCFHRRHEEGVQSVLLGEAAAVLRQWPM